MTEEATKIKNFTDLNAWKEAHKLAIAIYRLVEKFPQSEQFGLSSQIKRAVVSISSNIAEGFSRNTQADKNHFYIMAKSSNTEIQNQLLLARDVKYISGGEFQNLAIKSATVSKLLTGLIKSLERGNGIKK